MLSRYFYTISIMTQASIIDNGSIIFHNIRDGTKLENCQIEIFKNHDFSILGSNLKPQRLQNHHLACAAAQKK